MGKVTEGRRYCCLSIPTSEKVVWAEILSGKTVNFYKDEGRNEEIVHGKRYVLELEIPKEVKVLEIRKSNMPPICELGVNRKIWPIDEMIGLRIIFDNRNINMVDDEGEFRKEKYKQLYKNLSWKKWAMLLYKYKDGGYKAQLWWKR